MALGCKQYWWQFRASGIGDNPAYNTDSTYEIIIKNDFVKFHICFDLDLFEQLFSFVNPIHIFYSGLFLTKPQ